MRRVITLRKSCADGLVNPDNIGQLVPAPGVGAPGQMCLLADRWGPFSVSSSARPEHSDCKENVETLAYIFPLLFPLIDAVSVISGHHDGTLTPPSSQDKNLFRLFVSKRREEPEESLHSHPSRSLFQLVADGRGSP